MPATRIDVVEPTASTIFEKMGRGGTDDGGVTIFSSSFDADTFRSEGEDALATSGTGGLFFRRCIPGDGEVMANALDGVDFGSG